MDNNKYKFRNLINLFEQTQRELHTQVTKAIDITLVLRNWLFGLYIVEYEQNGFDRAEYGSHLFENLSKELKILKIKGSSVTRLKLYRAFYKKYKNIRPTVSDEFTKINHAIIRLTVSDVFIDEVKIDNQLLKNLSEYFCLGWSHYVTLLTIQSDEERNFYEIEARENNWSVRELKRQISTSLYERLALNRNKEGIKKLAKRGQAIDSVRDIIKNPYILEFLQIPEHPYYSEQQLETAIINKIEQFLLELGKGFLFEARQKRFSFDDDHFFVDLVFYNRLLRCYVLIDLKRDKLTHQDLGQMQMYVNYFDRYVKLAEEEKTVGIVMCHRKNDALVELTLPENSNIHASAYQLYLPTKDEFKKQLEEVRQSWEINSLKKNKNQEL